MSASKMNLQSIANAAQLRANGFPAWTQNKASSLRNRYKATVIVDDPNVKDLGKAVTISKFPKVWQTNPGWIYVPDLALVGPRASVDKYISIVAPGQSLATWLNQNGVIITSAADPNFTTLLVQSGMGERFALSPTQLDAMLIKNVKKVGEVEARPARDIGTKLRDLIKRNQSKGEDKILDVSLYLKTDKSGKTKKTMPRPRAQTLTADPSKNYKSIVVGALPIASSNGDAFAAAIADLKVSPEALVLRNDWGNYSKQSWVDANKQAQAAKKRIADTKKATKKGKSKKVAAATGAPMATVSGMSAMFGAAPVVGQAPSGFTTSFGTVPSAPLGAGSS